VRGVEDDSVDFLRWAGVDEAEILKEYLVASRMVVRFRGCWENESCVVETHYQPLSRDYSFNLQ
jgi:hypothetical protein